MASATTEDNKSNRVVALLDIDAFECQVWQRMYNEYFGPCIVVDKTGRITSATYEAKDLGISRDIRIGDARKLAREAKAELKVFEKPNDREKPDCKETRYASWEIVDALKEYSELYSYGIALEYASSDEVFLDITEEVRLRMEDRSKFSQVVETNTFLESDMESFQGPTLGERMLKVYDGGFEKSERLQNEEVLVHGALFMQEMALYVFQKTRFVASVGIGNNKLMAKLAVSLHRPNGITVFTDGALRRLGGSIPLEKIPGLGGKFGQQLKEMFQIKTINDLKELSFAQMEDVYGLEKAFELYHKCRGCLSDDDPVKKKYFNDEVNCGKRFWNGQIKTEELLQFHFHLLVEEMLERLEEERTRHNRIPMYLKAQMFYSDNFTSTDEKKWSVNVENARQMGVQEISDFVISKILEQFENILDKNVTRLCVSAKAFQLLPKQNSTRPLPKAA